MVSSMTFSHPDTAPSGAVEACISNVLWELLMEAGATLYEFLALEIVAGYRGPSVSYTHLTLPTICSV